MYYLKLVQFIKFYLLINCPFELLCLYRDADRLLFAPVLLLKFVYMNTPGEKMVLLLVYKLV